ncbi:acyl-CoA N-acyltransferase [Gymnopus androsaceus JB14]|uniref:Acyl-CoA N-acyltransferase n=1 Tax=Gymnopus androsaceus JB14 TaxID=1447944 RepID=A0A6A4HYB9_9AGAR|nr:acyl-CoA N-acyltransferase [Gymnopus androsaceus JB14]
MVGFESQRLRFRELRQSDLPLAQSMFNDYNFQENGGVDYTIPRGTDFIENWARWAKSCLIFVIIEEKVNGTFLGFTALNMPIVRNRDADFTIGILESEWGKGYGTEAARWMVDYGFRGLNVHRISLTVTETNDSAVSVYKKVGFVEEGRKRGAKWVDGKWLDYVVMGIVEEDFWSTQKN